MPSINDQSEIQADDECLYFTSNRHSFLYVIDINNGKQISQLELGPTKNFTRYEKNILVFDCEKMAVSLFDRTSGTKLMTKEIDEYELKEKPNLRLIQYVNGKSLILDLNSLKLFFD